MSCLSPTRENLRNFDKLKMKLNQKIVVLIFIFLILQEKSCAAANRVKKVNVVTTKEGESDYFSLQKGTEAFARMGGRKMKGSRKVSHSVGNYRKDEEEGNVMAFTKDYHPPKPHPPKNN